MNKSTEDRYAAAKARFGGKPAPKDTVRAKPGKISLKGTNPLKRRAKVTWSKEF